MKQAVLKKIRAYRTRIRACVTVEGASLAAVAVVALVFLSLLTDYTQRMGIPARIFSLVLGLAIIAYVLRRSLFSKLARPMDDERIALTVEDRFPELRDRLISALQFSRVLESGAGGDAQSRAMMAAVSSGAAAAVEPLDLGRTIDYGRVLKSFAAAAVAWTVLIAVAAFEPATMRLWFRRNILLSSEAWPQRTHLDVDYTKVIPKGDALTVTVTAGGEVPSRVIIRYEQQGSGRKGEEKLARVGLLAENRFEAKFKNVVEPLRFRVAGGDATTEWFEVKLVERPAFNRIKFWAVYPPYTRVPSQALAAAESFLEVLPGTTLEVAVVPTKPLKRAWLAMGDEAGNREMTRADDQESRDFWLTADEKKVVGELWTGSLECVADGPVAVKAVDTIGLSNRPPARFIVKLVADKPPLVTLRMKGIGEMVVPKATIPLEIRAADDYGVQSLLLKHKFMMEEKYADEETIPFKQGVVFGGKEVVHQTNWRLARLALPVGSVLMFHAEAADYKDVEPANVGRTEAISLRVVTPAELTADLVRRQIEQRQDFVHVNDRQREEVAIEIDAALRAVRGGNALTDDQKTRLLAAHQTLRHSGDEVKQIADMFEQVLLEMINNKLGNPEERSKLRTGIIAPLRKIGAELIPELADGLKAVPAATAPALEKKLAGLAALNARVLKLMDLALGNMLKMETYRRIVEQIRALRDDQEELFKELDKERKKILDSLLDPGRETQ